MQINLNRQAALRIFGLYFMGIASLAFLLSSTTIRNSQRNMQAAKHRALIDRLEILLTPETMQVPETDLTGLQRLIGQKRERNQKREASKAQRASLIEAGLLTPLRPAAKRPVVATAAAGDESTEFGDNNQRSGKFVPQDQDIEVIPVKYSADLDDAGRALIRSTIIDRAKKHLGTRYVWAGKTPKGFDCSGFTSYMMSQYGISVSPSSRHQALQGKAKPLAQAETGDLIFFSRYGKGGRISHVALVVENSPEGIFVIHATSRGIVIDNIHESSYWKPKILFARDVISK